MKKYKRLCLFLLLCLSLILVFIYRHKYSKLSLLFEMMNSFQFKDSDAKYNKKLLEFKGSLDIDFHKKTQISGVPYWVEIFPGIYIYSSYWVLRLTRTLTFAKNVPPHILKEIQCKLSYKNRDHPFKSKMNIIFIEKKVSKLYLYLECVPSFDNEIPYSITFIHKNMTSTVILPDMSEQLYSGHTMCLKPLQPAFDDVLKLSEFIIYHSHIGVKYFIFYERGMSFNAKKLLIDVAMKDGAYILLLPWNVPLDSESDFDNAEVSFLDCYHHLLARNFSNILLKMDLDNFIVPKNKWSLEHLIKDVESPLSVFKFHQKTFCSEYRKDIIADSLNMPFITLLRTKYLSGKNDPVKIGFDVSKLENNVLNSVDFQLWLYQRKGQKAHLIPEASIVLHSYKTCNVKSEEEAVEDKSMWKFKDTYFKSHIYLLAKKMNLING